MAKSAEKTKEKKGISKMFSSIGRFFRDIKAEVKKIVWPTGKATMKNTFIVIVACVIIGVFVWIFDFGFGKLVDWFLSLAK